MAGELGWLLVGDLAAREEALRLVIEQATAGEREATAMLRWLVENYRQVHPTIYSRAMNWAAFFVDASLEMPLRAALDDEQYGCQAWAAMGCGAAGLRSAVPQLRALLAVDDWFVRVEAATALGALGDDAVVADLVTALRHPVSSTREAAAEALAAIGSVTAMDGLWAEFERSAPERIGYIASALSRFGPMVADRLRLAAGGDDPDRRYWAAIALGAMADEADVEMLQRLVEDDSITTFGRRVRTGARQALRTSARVRRGGR